MKKTRYTYWRDGDARLGYLEEYPDYWTQGRTQTELKASLADIYRELTSGRIPNVRRTAQLVLA